VTGDMHAGDMHADDEEESFGRPFLGWTMKGRALVTIVGGRIVHDERRAP